jgi:dTDP-4-amino-4,6-dideoxygalactose transaminase
VAGIVCPQLPADTIYNHAYFPILINKEYPISRDGLNDKLRQHGIFARRYFYPLISEFPMYRGLPSAAQSNLPIAKKAADQVLCLPIYPALEDESVAKIVSIIAYEK